MMMMMVVVVVVMMIVVVMGMMNDGDGGGGGGGGGGGSGGGGDDNSLICFTDLSSQLFNKRCIESPHCLCDNICENTKHFIMVCPLNDAVRTSLITRLQQLSLLVPLVVLLYGNTSLTPDTIVNTGTPLTTITDGVEY